MIVGIGCDVVQITRIEKIIKTWSKKFLDKIYTINEIENSKKYTNKKLYYSYFAKRWAAKEAFVKAIGTGFRENIKFCDIEIVNSIIGKPEIILHNDALKKIKAIEPNYKINITLSDDYPTAIAFIVISR